MLNGKDMKHYNMRKNKALTKRRKLLQKTKITSEKNTQTQRNENFSQ